MLRRAAPSCCGVAPLGLYWAAFSSPQPLQEHSGVVGATQQQPRYKLNGATPQHDGTARRCVAGSVFPAQRPQRFYLQGRRVMKRPLLLFAVASVGLDEDAGMRARALGVRSDPVGSDIRCSLSRNALKGGGSTAAAPTGSVCAASCFLSQLNLLASKASLEASSSSPPNTLSASNTFPPPLMAVLSCRSDAT